MVTRDDRQPFMRSCRVGIGIVRGVGNEKWHGAALQPSRIVTYVTVLLPGRFS